VVLLFAVFVVIQFQYFFGGQANIHIDGYTYAEYTRRGFSELVAVAFFALLLYLGLSAIVKRETPGQRWGFSGLGIGMVALVGIILVSAFRRLLLYEAAYGFSRLRAYTHVFMIWLGVLLAVVVVLEILRRERAFAAAALLAAIGFAVTLSLLNVDAFIVRQNVARAPDGKGLDVPYLASLTTDAVPALAAAFQDQSLSGLTRDAVGAVLACRVQETVRNPDTNWRAFTFSRLWANQALKQVQGQLDAYRVLDDDWPVKVLTPGSVTYECYQGGMGD
jgi:fumarate reductase subunit C